MFVKWSERRVRKKNNMIHVRKLATWREREGEGERERE